MSNISLSNLLHLQVYSEFSQTSGAHDGPIFFSAHSFKINGHRKFMFQKKAGDP